MTTVYQEPAPPGSAVLTLGNRSDASGRLPYQPLASSYVHHARQFQLVKRVGDVAMFCAESETHLEFEVVIVRRQKARIFRGRSFPAAEVVPSASQWGKYGWTYTDSRQTREACREQAESRFKRQVE